MSQVTTAVEYERLLALVAFAAVIVGNIALVTVVFFPFPLTPIIPPVLLRLRLPPPPEM